MHYEEPEDEDFQPRRPISEQTAYMRWSTEIERDEENEIVDKKFIKNHRPRVIDINKFLPLSNITDKRQVKLFRLRRMNMTLAQDAGLEDVAEETTLDNLADYETSRGINGFYQKALITQRQEFKDQSIRERDMGFWGRLLNKDKKQNSQQGNSMQEGLP